MKDEDIQTNGMEEVDINGIKYLVTPEMARAMKSEKEANARLVRQREEEIQRQQQIIMQKQEAKQEQQPVESESTPLADRLFVEPDKVLAELESSIEQRLTKKYEQAEEQKLRAQSEAEILRKFYAEFFSKNPHLKDDEQLVKMVLQTNYHKWTSLDEQALMEELEKETTSTIIRHSKKEASDDVIVEGVTNVTPFNREPVKEEKTESLSSIMKKRAESRRKAS